MYWPRKPCCLSVSPRAGAQTGSAEGWVCGVSVLVRGVFLLDGTGLRCQAKGPGYELPEMAGSDAPGVRKGKWVLQEGLGPHLAGVEILSEALCLPRVLGPWRNGYGESYHSPVVRTTIPIPYQGAEKGGQYFWVCVLFHHAGP